MAIGGRKKIFQIAKELNLATETIKEFLERKGINVTNPNMRISEEEYELILKRFSFEKKEADRIHRLREERIREEQEIEVEQIEEQEIEVKQNIEPPKRELTNEQILEHIGILLQKTTLKESEIKNSPKDQMLLDEILVMISNNDKQFNGALITGTKGLTHELKLYLQIKGALL